jgi:hypothetical protein
VEVQSPAFHSSVGSVNPSCSISCLSLLCLPVRRIVLILKYPFPDSSFCISCSLRLESYALVMYSPSYLRARLQTTHRISSFFSASLDIRSLCLFSYPIIQSHSMGHRFHVLCNTQLTLLTEQLLTVAKRLDIYSIFLSKHARTLID